MSGKFQWQQFTDVNLQDSFFDSLKLDYQEFPAWFQRKCNLKERALVFKDDIGIGAFVYLKSECEAIKLTDRILPPIHRIKIGTLCLAERFRGIRLGEGALGVSLWKWQEQNYDEIYVTVFERHQALIRLFERFGFTRAGMNSRGECVYLKNRNSIGYENPYTAFPFIRPQISKAGLIPIEEIYHDKLFPYSELKGNKNEVEEETAGNGITKIYICSPFTPLHYIVGEPVFIYRIFNGNGKVYRSVITSYCTITKIEIVKSNGSQILSLNDFIQNAGNKTVFSTDELTNIYDNKKNVVLIELIYNGFFGKGHNVTYKELSEKGLFPSHPYNIDYSKNNFFQILEMGDVNVQNVIID